MAKKKAEPEGAQLERLLAKAHERMTDRGYPEAKRPPVKRDKGRR